ncbi:hypothetical protein FisN_16Lh163 [Fistulifera solaris]|uniref:Exonuclease domain-containing protein n=1 Tax=Fistulifera solaris TaxID=1519565 RepID=A0A1Z5KJ60_FISSO|nr:hypothetical protein FisN_16Lh163 [Fistulifera solaris]|eukprot:GAX26324.1 hypothetical protein FisN_16Lh163 [Fistulifera solaris]
MFGLAFSGAKRGEEYGLRVQKSAQLRKSTKFVVPKVTHAEDPVEKANLKRNRRRRRPKKPQPEGTTYPKILSKKPHDTPMTKRDLYFCLRCGMVVVGKQGMDSAVGRVVLVNWENETVFDKFVKVPLHVADYSTSETGISEKDLSSSGAITFDQARKEVGRLIKGKILIGHGLEVDLASLGLSHPSSDTRDTATYTAYMKEVTDVKSPMLLPQELSTLSKKELGRDVGIGPVSQAKVCLELYKAARSSWETELMHLMQQKERQRQMVMSMRASSQGNSRINGISVPLSAIRENDALLQQGYRQGGPAFPCTSSVDSGSQSGSYYYDDELTSETSYFSFETDNLSTVSPNRAPALSEFSVSSQGRASVLSQPLQYYDVDYSERRFTDVFSAPQNREASKIKNSRASSVLSNLPGPCDRTDIWGVSKPLGYIASPSQDAHIPKMTTFASEDKRDEGSLWSAVSMEQCGPEILNTHATKPPFSDDEELLRHLPSALLADLDQDINWTLCSNPTVEKETAESSTLWYRTRRKQKSLSDFGLRHTSESGRPIIRFMRTSSLDNIIMKEEKKTPGIWFRSLRMPHASR